MPRRKQALIEVLEDMGEFGVCSCGGRILYYSDYGVRCERCRTLHGTWGQRKRA